MFSVVCCKSSAARVIKVKLGMMNNVSDLHRVYQGPAVEFHEFLFRPGQGHTDIIEPP